jgi:hypothetical protein
MNDQLLSQRITISIPDGLLYQSQMDYYKSNNLDNFEGGPFQDCHLITITAINDILEHCKEICYLKFYNMMGLTKADMNYIARKLSHLGKVDHTKVKDVKNTFVITKRDPSAI